MPSFDWYAGLQSDVQSALSAVSRLSSQASNMMQQMDEVRRRVENQTAQLHDYDAALRRSISMMQSHESDMMQQASRGIGSQVINESPALYVGEMNMNSEVDATRLESALAAIARRRNRGYGA